MIIKAPDLQQHNHVGRSGQIDALHKGIHESILRQNN